MGVKEIKSFKGITLIALVITIIVVLILGGVAINTLTEDSITENGETSYRLCPVAFGKYGYYSGDDVRGSGGKTAYKGAIENGTIQGKFPTYIYNKETGMVYSVTGLGTMCYEEDAKKITTLPKLPVTLKRIGNCAGAFQSCTELKSIMIPQPNFMCVARMVIVGFSFKGNLYFS